MRYAEYEPSPGLARLVERFWILEGAGTGVADAIFPDGRIEIVFHYSGTFWRRRDDEEPPAPQASSPAPVEGGEWTPMTTSAPPERQPDAMVVGQMLAPVILAPEGAVGVAAVRLRPAAARTLLGFPSTDIAGRFVDLDLLFGSTSSIREQLAEAVTDAARIALLEGWLTRHVRGTPKPRIEAVVRGMAASGGRASIDELAEASGLHVRQLERHFLHEVGLTPKTFARISRLQLALARVRAGAPLSDVALACGFYDQAHMARDFRQLASMSPRAWQAHAGELAPLFVSGGRQASITHPPTD